jgi:hypothetical protein
MPDVGLTTATEPLDPSYRVVIKYSVEVEGLPVYNESYDVRKLAQELEEDSALVEKLWLRRLHAAVEARHENAFSATLTGKLATGTAAEAG